MSTQRAIQALQTAIRSLEVVADEPGCEWCQEKANELRQAVEELRVVMPIAEEMKQRVDVLAAQNLTSIRRDIGRAHVELTTSRPDELVGSPLLRQAPAPAPPAAPVPSDVPKNQLNVSMSVFDRETFKEAKEFFQVRPLVRDMLKDFRENKKDRFTLKGLFG